jgi:hypothetical protein
MNASLSFPLQCTMSKPLQLKVSVGEPWRKGGACSGCDGLLAALSALALLGDASSQAQPFVWTEKKFELPSSIRIFEGVAVADSGEPVRAWYADINYSDLALKAVPYLSQDALGREPVSAMSKKLNAYVAINGGYFDMGSVPARTFSLVLQNNRVLVPNIARVSRPGKKYDVTRSAFGIRANRTLMWRGLRISCPLLRPQPRLVFTATPNQRATRAR